MQQPDEVRRQQESTDMGGTTGYWRRRRSEGEAGEADGDKEERNDLRGAQQGYGKDTGRQPRKRREGKVFMEQRKKRRDGSQRDMEEEEMRRSRMKRKGMKEEIRVKLD